ncbi:hypothetical protein BC833DRAFT_42443 [Globomyces pollinis-pini]|nr:hypothetical protein BC833DRAFT_42443 [Globomyces pollinis-pini]
MTKSQSWDDTPYSHEDHQRDQHLNKRPKTLSWDQHHAVPQLNSIEHQQNSTDTKGNDSIPDTKGNQSLNKYAQYLTASKSNVGIKVVKIPQQITRLHTTDINDHSLRKSNSVKDEFHGQSRQTNIKTTIIPNTKIPTKPAMERNNNTVLPITEPMKLYASIKPQRSNKTNANIVSNLATVKLYGNNSIKKTSQKPVTIKKESFQRSVSLKKESDSGFIPNHSNPSENVSNTATFTISDTEIPKIGIVSKSKTQKLKRVIEHPLSVEQQHILNKILVEKKSIFFTGKAGTGKSFLLRSIIHKAKSLFKEDEIAVTGIISRLIYSIATTGLAGYNIGGSTLHSFAGIGIANRINN